MNFSKLLFSSMLISSTLISISSKNWIGIWMGMEMNLMSFIPLISKSKNIKSSKAMMIYFLSQSIGSMIMLFSIIMSKFMFISPMEINNIMKTFIMISLLIKLGASPFHNWLPKMMINMSWYEAIILMTWQKIIPMFMMTMILPNNYIFIPILLSAFIGAIGGLNYSSMMKIMAYSSINHMSWMLAMMSSQLKWFNYLIMYSILTIMSGLFFNYYNIYYLNQISTNINSISEKLTISSLMLSMGGLPPFLGFLPKWMVIQSLINLNISMLMFLVMSSLLTLFFYMRVMSPLLLFYSSINKFSYKKKSNYIYLILIFNFMLPVFSILNF
uniref:NADH dehydrogenase subunit 2 n=1 Tax=Dimorphopterus gibbus TaxID=2969359 RepID=UPI002176CEF0|nr:NADH dehydrogenase subunit 2 [Dimorphopterus gibbus]UUJ37751.1 NADH dehydrogenase subunit 2 [Dimorphopterus gibbus]